MDHSNTSSMEDRGKSSHMPTPKLTNEIIAAAVEGYEAQKVRIDGKIAELRAMLPGGSPEAAAAPKVPTRKREVSAAARRRMAIAQKKRWAAIKGVADAEPPAPKEAPKPKRRISKEGLARIVAATKKVSVRGTTGLTGRRLRLSALGCPSYRRKF